MTGQEGGGRAGGEEMAERGSSSRKRGRGVKWRQVFHDKPYNPPPLLYSSSLGRHQSAESTANQPKNRHLLVISLFLCYLLLLAFIQPPYPSDLISPTKLRPFPFNPRFLSTVSSVCFPHCCGTTWLCGFEIV